MHKRKWMSLMAAIAGGAMLFQAPTCTQQVTAISSLVTAGSVLVLVDRVLND